MDYIKYSEFMAANSRAKEAYALYREAYATGNREDTEAARQLFNDAIDASNAAFEELKKS